MSVQKVEAACAPPPAEATPSLWDRIGIGVSGLCLVHCLFVPIVLALLPLWPLAEVVHAWLHPVFAVLLVPTTLLAMRSGFRQHRAWHVQGLLGGGLVVILAAGVLGHAMPGAFSETLVTLVGSVLLITGHWRNWRLCASCGTHPL